MLDKAEIRKEIARLEYEESSYPNYAKLADLYVIRDKMQEEEQGSLDARANARLSRFTSSNDGKRLTS